MRRAASAVVLLAGLAVFHPGAAIAQPGASPTGKRPLEALCRAPEIALFNCWVESRAVSICGQERGAAVYRFGRPARIELEATDLHFAEHAFSGGGETQVYADTPTERIIVYDRVVRTSIGDDGRHDPQEGSGVAVQRAGRTVSTQSCAQPATFGRLTRALVPAGHYVAH